MNDCGLYTHNLGKRDAVLTGARVSPQARARILGQQYFQPAAKTHRITIDLAKPEERTVETVDPSQPTEIPESVQPPKVERAVETACRDLPVTALHRKVPNATPTIRAILEATADAFSVTLYMLLGAQRDQKVARARFAAAKLMRERRLMSTSRIAFALGGRDHTTILAQLIRADALLGSDEDWTTRYHAAVSVLGPIQ